VFWVLVIIAWVQRSARGQFFAEQLGDGRGSAHEEEHQEQKYVSTHHSNKRNINKWRRT